LVRKAVFEDLTTDSFLHAIYDLLLEHKRLGDARQDIPRFARTLFPHIQKLNHAAKRLARIETEIVEGFLPAYKSILGWELEKALETILERIAFIQRTLDRRKKITGTRIPAAGRKGREATAHELLLKDVDYDLPKGGEKAGDQWLWERLNHFIEQFLESKKVRLSRSTRLKLIAAIVDAANITRVTPGALKEFFRSNTPTAI
jgi:hypothetical protein